MICIVCTLILHTMGVVSSAKVEEASPFAAVTSAALVFSETLLTLREKLVLMIRSPLAALGALET